MEKIIINSIINPNGGFDLGSMDTSHTDYGDILTEECLEKNQKAQQKLEELEMLLNKTFSEDPAVALYQKNRILENIDQWNNQYAHLSPELFHAFGYRPTPIGRLRVFINIGTDQVKFALS